MKKDQKAFANQTVVFTGKLASMSRKEAQQIVREQGGHSPESLTSAATFLVVGEEGALKQDSKSSKLKRAEELIEQGKKIQIISESNFLEMVNLDSRYRLEHKYYALSEILKIYKALRKEHIKYFQRWGLLKPVTKTNIEEYFQFKDLLLFRKINNYLSQGKKLRSIARGLHNELFATEQLKIEFEEERPKGKILTLTQTTSPEFTAEEWYEIGDRYDADRSTYDQAIEAYERALALDPDYFPAAVNLANIYFEKGEIQQAEALYLRALTLEPASHKILFNLGNLYDEMGEYEKALEYFRKAIEQFPLYADAHFNIAVVYEKIGLILKAKAHWQTYLKIDDSGEWADIAREHLSGLDESS